jgi:hypothetical protein
MFAAEVINGDVFVIGDKIANIFQCNKFNAATGFGADVTALIVMIGC